MWAFRAALLFVGFVVLGFGLVVEASVMACVARYRRDRGLVGWAAFGLVLVVGGSTLVGVAERTGGG